MLKRKKDKNIFFTRERNLLKKNRKRDFMQRQKNLGRLFREQNRTIWWKKMFYYLMTIGLFVLTIFLIYLVLFSNFFLLKEIAVTNSGQTKTLSKEHIRNNLSELRGQNLMFLDLDQVVKTLMEKNPRLKTVEAEKLYPENLKVSYEEYEIVVHLSNPLAERSYLVNEAGLVVQKGNISEAPQLIHVEVARDTDFHTDQVAILREDLDYLQEVVKTFTDKIGLAVTNVFYYPTRRELHVENEKGFQVWFDFKRPVEDIFDDLFRVLSNTETAKGNFSVLDLRIKGKVFVCHREEGCINYAEEKEENK